MFLTLEGTTDILQVTQGFICYNGTAPDLPRRSLLQSECLIASSAIRLRWRMQSVSSKVCLGASAGSTMRRHTDGPAGASWGASGGNLTAFCRYQRLDFSDLKVLVGRWGQCILLSWSLVDIVRRAGWVELLCVLRTIDRSYEGSLFARPHAYIAAPISKPDNW